MVINLDNLACPTICLSACRLTTGMIDDLMKFNVLDIVTSKTRRECESLVNSVKISTDAVSNIPSMSLRATAAAIRPAKPDTFLHHAIS